MIKLLFIIYYDAKNYLSYIKELFEKYHIIITTYPLFKFAYDANDKIENYQDNLCEFIDKNDPDMIFWWFIDVPVNVFKNVRENNKNRYFIIYNSDDPYNLSKEIFDKCKNFDLILTTSMDSIIKYKKYSSVENIIYMPFGYDPNIYFPISNNEDYGREIIEYGCDISIYCYDFYLDKNKYYDQTVYLLDLLNNISTYAKNNKKIFRIYGGAIIKEYLPDNYGGDIEYFRINCLYNFSKINLCLHGTSSVGMALNHYVFPIMASGGLMMIDPIKDINKIIEDNSCIFLSPDNYIKQIDDILINYAKNPDYYNEMKINAINNSKKYSWDENIKKIMIEYGKKNFNPQQYSKLYNLNCDDLLSYWINVGINNYELCFNFRINENFNHEKYIIDNNITQDNREYAYFHWYTKSKNNKYIIQLNSGQKNIDVSKMGITIEQYFKISNILTNIRVNSGHHKLNYLVKLQKYCDNNPVIEINEILESYFSMV